MVGEGRAKAVVEEGEKDKGKARIVEESKWGKEREREKVGVTKKERKKVMVEGEGKGEGGLEEGGGETCRVFLLPDFS